MHRPSALLVPALLAAACATGGGTDPALVEAGRLQRRSQPPPAAADLRREVDSFHDTELPLLQKEVDRRLARKARTWRLTFAGGAALTVLAASSGTVGSSDGAAKPVLVGVGAAAAVVGGVAWALGSPELEACRSFLDSARGDVDSWRRNAIPPGEGPVAPAVWAAWVDRVAAIRSHESCREVR